ncbi:MAG: hypothetical protein E7381_03525 [Clostridiales bacterium]|nr:hypothetical protein [Clostridiales bacterium]
MSSKKPISTITEKTPSKSQYFSWINNTNEGSTEQQTLANLGFFRYLYDTYGMQLDIYALDGGNLDCPRSVYGREDSERIKGKFPNGYAPCVQYAQEMGTRMGIWGWS